LEKFVPQDQGHSGRIATLASPVQAQWFVLHTRSRQEKAISRALDAMRCECFLPLVRKVHYQGRRKVYSETPLFPGYVFLHGTRDQAFDADRTDRIAQVIDVVDQRQLGEELASLKLALAAQAPMDPFPYLREGVRVVVRAGPLRGVTGFVESRLRMDRLILQVNVLGQASSLEIDGGLLDLLD